MKPILGLAISILLGLWLSCSLIGKPKSPLPALADMPHHTADDVFGPVDKALRIAAGDFSALLAEPAPAIIGRVRRIYGATVCAINLVGLPYISYEQTEPRAGEVWHAQVRAEYCSPAHEWPLAMIVGTESLDVALDPWGYDGCVLLVQPTWTIWPDTDPMSSFHRRVPDLGIADLAVRFPVDWVGRIIYIQPIEIAPQSVTKAPSGYVLGSGVELLIGSRAP